MNRCIETFLGSMCEDFPEISSKKFDQIDLLQLKFAN
jgi:hypothetical protein